MTAGVSKCQRAAEEKCAGQEVNPAARRQWWHVVNGAGGSRGSGKYSREITEGRGTAKAGHKLGSSGLQRRHSYGWWSNK